ncbi:MAG: sigma 54-interacting transcriptional regulator [Bryobacteraceae bacterium]|jgi:transcriptional regulator with AAA-type ATPase domain
MDIYSPVERRFLTAVARLAYSNPFLPERVEHERAALGREFVPGGPVWSASVTDPDAEFPNIARIHARLEPLIESIHGRLEHASDMTGADLAIYEESVHEMLYQRYYKRFGSAEERWQFYRQFLADWKRYFSIAGKRFETALQPAHVFACYRQIRRAFLHIFDNIIGDSMPAARLRASVWQSVFTHDMRRYRRILYVRMGDFPTLITGPSGTGKELVARAIAAARYVPFDPERLEFADAPGESFFAINLAALSPTLIESELFGHRRGAFTGATGDRKGWLDACPEPGSVFLDELGEMELSLQVKLLRVIETRRFSSVGDTALRVFRGKLIAATNRNLAEEIQARRFREDLYYRLCADLIRTPSLREQIHDSPQVLHDLLLYMVRRAVGDEAEQCLPEVEVWINAHLPGDYAWPGNYRELEQCVRNIIIRRSYQPIAQQAPAAADPFTARVQGGQVTAGELLAWYSALVYRQAGSYEEAARRLGLDRRTVKAKVESYLEKVAG